MAEQELKVREYWEDRAKQAKLNPNATTDDVFLRELEINTFIENIRKVKKKNLQVLDLGCGDGYTTIGVARALKNIHFIGADYSANMIENANNRLKAIDPELQKRVHFLVADATKLSETFKPNTFDIVISSRCLINLTSPKQQYKTISDIHKILKKGGLYISIENFEDGNKELNAVRKSLELDEISVRWHNLFFDPKEYLKKTNRIFKKVEIHNFSSSYYFATRIVYSKFCKMTNVKPDYNHEIHQLAIHLPSTGNFSPIKLTVHKK